MRIGTLTLIRADARKLAEVADSSVALIVTSPPYPMIPQWDELFASLGAFDYAAMHAVLRDVWHECARVLIPGGILAVNIGDAVRSLDGRFQLWPNHATVLVEAAAVRLRPLPFILWKKPTNKPNAFLGSGFLPPNAYVTLDCEYILLFRKGELRRFPRRDAVRQASRYRPGRTGSLVQSDLVGCPGSSAGVGIGSIGRFSARDTGSIDSHVLRCRRHGARSLRGHGYDALERAPPRSARDWSRAGRAVLCPTGHDGKEGGGGAGGSSEVPPVAACSRWAASSSTACLR